MKYNEQIKNLLDDVIADMTNNKTSFVKNPEKDFTRDRKLPFDKVIKIVLSMKGNTLNKELYDFFGRVPEEIVTTSAFIQQRDSRDNNASAISLSQHFSTSYPHIARSRICTIITRANILIG